MASRVWPGYEPDDVNGFPGRNPPRLNPSDPHSLKMQGFNDVGPSLSVASQPPKSLSFDTPPSSSMWDKGANSAPRHHTYPSPQAERDPSWLRSSSPATREGTHSNSSMDSPQMRNAFETSLAVPPSQDRQFVASSPSGIPVDRDTQSPRMAWERTWPSTQPSRPSISQATDLPAAVPMTTWGTATRPTTSALDAAYAARDLRWPDAATLGAAAYVPPGTKWPPPAVFAESNTVPSLSPWAAQVPAVPRRLDNASTTGADRNNQEISTLFIAGFPDDISDREFANIFLFAKGFEASMLKYPGPNPSKAEDSNDARNGTEHEKEGQAQESSGGRNRQIIGFAKFYTREEAFEAREVLNGFRIDPERGCILKAELAKKNLHTKRNAPFVVGKHNAPNAHMAASRGPGYDQLATGDNTAAYAAMIHPGIPSSYTKHYPTPLNATALADYSREAPTMLPMMPHSAPPRVNQFLPSVSPWSIPQGLDALPLPSNETHPYATPNTPGQTVPHDQIYIGMSQNRVPPVGHDSLPKRPDASIRQASFAEPRLSPNDTHFLNKEPTLGDRATEIFPSMDPTAALSRLNLNSDPSVSDLPSHECVQGNKAVSRQNSGDTHASQVFSPVMPRGSPVPVFSGAAPTPESKRNAVPDPSTMDPASKSNGTSQGGNSHDHNSPTDQPLVNASSQPSGPSAELDMEAMTSLEHAAYSKGFEQGIEKGRHFGHSEGRTLGREKGFEIWAELGYYLGTIRMWRQVLERDPSSNRKSQKQLQHLQNLEVLIHEMPKQNDSSLLEQEKAVGDVDDKSGPDLQKLLERIRARHKLACASLGMPSYAQQHNHDMNEEPINEQNGRAQDAPKSRYSRIGGQYVDISQLKY